MGKFQTKLGSKASLWVSTAYVIIYRTPSFFNNFFTQFLNFELKKYNKTIENKYKMKQE